MFYNIRYNHINVLRKTFHFTFNRCCWCLKLQRNTLLLCRWLWMEIKPESAHFAQTFLAPPCFSHVHRNYAVSGGLGSKTALIEAGLGAPPMAWDCGSSRDTGGLGLRARDHKDYKDCRDSAGIDGSEASWIVKSLSHLILKWFVSQQKLTNIEIEQP